jgi:hypothetical protein
LGKILRLEASQWLSLWLDVTIALLSVLALAAVFYEAFKP